MPRRLGPPTVAGMTDTALDPGRIRRVGETFIEALTARDFTRLLGLIADHSRQTDASRRSICSAPDSTPKRFP